MNKNSHEKHKKLCQKSGNEKNNIRETKYETSGYSHFKFERIRNLDQKETDFEATVLEFRFGKTVFLVVGSIYSLEKKESPYTRMYIVPVGFIPI